MALFRPTSLEGDEPEELEVIPWKLGNINELLATGEYTEARSIATLFMAVEYLKRRKRNPLRLP